MTGPAVPAVTALYAALLAVLVVALSINVVRHRWRARVGIGAGRDRLLEQAIRTHANAAEYVPFALVLMAFNELGGMAGWFVHALGAGLVAGRLLHAAGLLRSPGPSLPRSAGMGLTWAVLLAGAGGCLVVAL